MKSIRIRTRDLALLGFIAVLPDIDILLVPFFGWNIHKIWTHTLLAFSVFTVVMFALAFVIASSFEGRILFGLAIIAYGAHILLDFVMRSVPFFYPWNPSIYGFALLGSPTEYLQFSMFDTSIFGFFFLYFLITGFKTFRYQWDYPPSRFWYQEQFEFDSSYVVTNWFGFFKKQKESRRVVVRSLPPSTQGVRAGVPRIYLEFWSIDDPLELLYGSTFYEGLGELARDAELFIRIVTVSLPTADTKGSVTVELLPAKFTALKELIQRLTGRPFFEFQTEKIDPE